MDFSNIYSVGLSMEVHPSWHHNHIIFLVSKLIQSNTGFKKKKKRSEKKYTNGGDVHPSFTTFRVSKLIHVKLGLPTYSFLVLPLKNIFNQINKFLRFNRRGPNLCHNSLNSVKTYPCKHWISQTHYSLFYIIRFISGLSMEAHYLFS